MLNVYIFLKIEFSARFMDSEYVVRYQMEYMIHVLHPFLSYFLGTQDEFPFRPPGHCFKLYEGHWVTNVKVASES